MKNLKKFLFAGIALCAATLPLRAALAEEVTLEFGAINLLGHFEDAGQNAPGTVALITHGTLGHGGMETVAGLQRALAERGIASLAHNISYGIDKRRDMYHCAVDHIHHAEDADKEIAAWDAWLRERGARNVALIGHGRGGRQVARVAASGDIKPAAVVLLAPMTRGSEQAERDGFEELYRAPLEPMIAAARESKPDASLDTPGFLFCPDAHVRASSILSYYGEDPVGTEEYARQLKRIRTLVIEAENDEEVTDVYDSFEELDDGDRLVVEIVDSAEHDFLDFFADDAADLIAAFLARESGETFGIDWDAVDLAYGEYLGGECATCHTGAGAGAVPGLVGLPPDYFYSALRAYGSGTRDNPAMKSVVGSLDAEQMIALSAYFSSLQPE